MKQHATPATIRFYGHPAAELFSRELAESILGALQTNYVSEGSDSFPAGFVKASIPGHPWDDTCWTRDCGVFLREASLWGYWDHAIPVAEYLMDHVERNAGGFHSFPMFFKGKEKKSGSEMDGTCAIIIGLIRLWQRLADDHRLKNRIHGFLHGGASPLMMIHELLKRNLLIAGSGEFGGGWTVEGDWYNVVQNSLARQALIAGAGFEAESGDGGRAQAYRKDAEFLRESIERQLASKEDDAWIWCIDPATMRVDVEKLSLPHVKGTASINGAGAAYADAEGLEPLVEDPAAAGHMLATLRKVYEQYPSRKSQFEKYGMCTFVDENDTEPFLGYTSWLSYCDCYAAQVMALLDQPESLGRVMNWIAGATYWQGSPPAGFLRDLAGGKAGSVLDGAPSRYWFNERNFSPDWAGAKDIGCGPLNLINVAEPMKLARLISGIGDISGNAIKIIPRLPSGWQGYEAQGWPVKTANGVVLIDVEVACQDASHQQASIRINIRGGKSIPELMVRFPNGTRITLLNAQGQSILST